MITIAYDDTTFKEYLNIFSTKRYLQTLSNNYAWLVSDYCILPFIVKQKYIIKCAQFTNQVLYKTPHVSIATEQQFLNQCIELFKTLGIQFLLQPPTHVVFKTFPNGSLQVPYGTYQLNLTKTEEDLFKQLHSKHRNVIRKAKKEGVIVKRGIDQLAMCHKLLYATMARSQMWAPDLDLIKRLSRSLGEHIQFFAAYKENEVQGVAIIPWDQKSAYYLYGGSIPTPLTGAVNYMHWKIITYFKSKNVEKYDLVGARINPSPGSKLEGIQRFKSRFGGTLHKGHLWKFTVSAFHSKLYSSFLKANAFLTNTSFNGDIIDQEINRQSSI